MLPGLFDASRGLRSREQEKCYLSWRRHSRHRQGRSIPAYVYEHGNIPKCRCVLILASRGRSRTLLFETYQLEVPSESSPHSPCRQRHSARPRRVSWITSYRENIRNILLSITIWCPSLVSELFEYSPSRSSRAAGSLSLWRDGHLESTDPFGL
ncbi:hypothetical protein BJX68DRAFT_231096 [Aspergillus pseudodeflectus]|uniref:Uncharacterized protein n=1 Tax=Aspergillus pseudodeflectus TaxID=176178 RepID=A0ABR4KTW7_9EURO